MVALNAIISSMFPVMLSAGTNTVDSGAVLQEFGTYLSQLISWAGTVLTNVWDTPVLRVLCFLAIPLIAIGVLARLMRSI